MTPGVKCCFDLGSARDSRAMLGDPPSICGATKVKIFGESPKTARGVAYAPKQ